MRKIPFLAPAIIALLVVSMARSQVTFPVNGVTDKREGNYAFTNATIVKDAQTTITNATLIIRDGKIAAVGTNVTVPNDVVIIDCKGKYLYPSFIDIYSDYGIPALQRPAGAFNFFGPVQLTSNQKGAFGWNQALHTEVNAGNLFSADEAKAKPLRDAGFGSVLSHQKDGIARGTGVVATLADERDNLVVIKEKASAHYSFNKGSSTQSYPTSMMGMIALLRQTYIDAAWYKSNPSAEGINLTLQYWNEQQSLPQIFDAGDKWNDLRADRVGDEFGVQYIIKGGGNEYQRIKEMANTKAAFILPLNFPAAFDVDDPNDLRFTRLDELKHWELAPSNPAAFEKAGINFCLTAADLNNLSDFTSNLRKSIEYGLSEKKALEALTKNPATLLGIYDKVGSLETGKLANFLITTGPLFNEKTVILQNWVQGKKYLVKDENWTDIKGVYSFILNTQPSKTYTVELKDDGNISIVDKDTLTGKYSFDGKLIKLSFAERKGAAETILSGVAGEGIWSGTGKDTVGNSFTWTARYTKSLAAKADSTKPKQPLSLGKVIYPFLAFGWDEAPRQETVLFKNATVWTNEKDGKLSNTDVLVKNGKIAAIGKNLSDASARVIDGTNKHLTPGIIDEHSHIAAASINEGGQSVTSEVRIGDNLNPDDINIYRQLSGGVTSSHILHGSANTIGGQTQLIKLRWGANDDDLKFKGADPFIKFALGENVKRSGATQGNPRFPDTRMGVEEVMVDAFTRATNYKRDHMAADSKLVRRDLELDALVEIMDKKRFITCHSYVQSEIVATMRVAEKFGFKINTFTHILEGYKVADKMKAHGANVSTFSDWWNYKMEVVDAIAYNAGIMERVGLNVAINSDDAEMARRLNQEAAKTEKYGGVSEEEALKMVTLNPAKMLHVDSKVGSIATGKDADLVLWSDHPLSIYAKSLITMVEGTVYFDRQKDSVMRRQVSAEKARLIKKMAEAKKSSPPGTPSQRARPRAEVILSCDDHDHNYGILVVDREE